MYGLLWEYENLNVVTHDILHELFGAGTTKIFLHLSKMTRKGLLISYEGKDVYIPHLKKRDRLRIPEYRQQMDLLNVPMLLFNGKLTKSSQESSLR